MKTLKELYQIVLSQFIENQKITRTTAFPNYQGICSAIIDCYCDSLINSEELETLQFDFKKRRPGIFNSEFYQSAFNRKEWLKSNRHESTSHFWWERNEAGYECRTIFLQKIIKSL